jgi:hypothetical protein
MADHLTRRLVTGNDDAGRARFLRDGPSPRILKWTDDGPPVTEWLWATDGPTSLQSLREDPAELGGTFFPDRHGTRFFVSTIQPGYGLLPGLPFSERQARMEAVGLQMNTSGRPADDDHMHASVSIDFGAVLEGRVCLRLPDGDERVLSAGDCLVQLGNEHAWVNRGQVVCRIAFVVVGADC